MLIKPIPSQTKLYRTTALYFEPKYPKKVLHFLFNVPLICLHPTGGDNQSHFF